MKQRLLRSFSLLGWKGFAGQMCLCFDGLFCFYGMLLGVWGNTVCCSIDHPLYRQDLLVGCCLWGGVLCENCIVDANAIIINGNGNNDCCCCLFFLFCGFVLGIFCCLCVKIVCVFCF